MADIRISRILSWISIFGKIAAGVIIFGWNSAIFEFSTIATFQIQLHYGKRTMSSMNGYDSHISLVQFAQAYLFSRVSNSANETKECSVYSD